MTTARERDRTAPRTTPARPDGREPAAWLPLLAVSLGFFMVILDVTVVTVAVPSIGTALDAGSSSLQWIVDGYTLVFACLMLPCGALGDRFGHRRAFVGGLLVFGAASAACGASTTAVALVAARLAQGVGAALMVPASLALLRAAYAEPAARARAFGAWGALSGLGAAAGPLVGGLAVWGLSWRAVFLVNLPFALLALVLTRRYVPSPGPDRGARVAVAPQVACVAGLAAVTGGLNEAGARGWPDPLVLGCLTGGALSLACAVPLARGGLRKRPERGSRRALERRPEREPEPRRGRTREVRPQRTRRTGLAGGCAVGLLLNLGFYGLLFLATLYFQRQRGYGALSAGLALLPMFVVMAGSSFVSGRLAARTGPRLPMTAGLLTGAAGLAGWLLAGPHTPYAVLVAPMALSGLGTSFAMPAATTAVMESAPDGRSGAAAAGLNAARQVGSALGVALFGSLAAGRPPAGLHLAALLAAGAFCLAAVMSAATAPGRPDHG
ncbi:MFS transporter [Streptomyces sp. ICBB 8177]|uniref:MFS transporter n=1 Tax=Streptomyces sp. ICBB 8177 TaxID=563922 RepID=UPI000D67A22F|nr:MFS transporter [Streptomyces sp. ICBB 8177]PWI42677.1 MFS transporter [Streptomyces sp. ICBB 8177]